MLRWLRKTIRANDERLRLFNTPSNTWERCGQVRYLCYVCIDWYFSVMILHLLLKSPISVRSKLFCKGNMYIQGREVLVLWLAYTLTAVGTYVMASGGPSGGTVSVGKSDVLYRNLTSLHFIPHSSLRHSFAGNYPSVTCVHTSILVLQLPIPIPIPRGRSEPSGPGKPFLPRGEAPVDIPSRPLIYMTPQLDTPLEFKSMMCI